ncbi:MAG: DUF3854 domain-containing protein [Planctomycetota bacterium]|nr:DUF3854 domain-containing protein [Planctomycetota bacterium]
MSLEQDTTFAAGSNENPTTTPNLLCDHHLLQLAASGISTKLATEVGLRSANADQVSALLDRKKPVGSGLVIPFHDPLSGLPLRSADGQEFVRVRLDDPSQAQDRDDKPCKYLSRRGAGQFPYITQRAARAIRDGANEILLVEGEKKALSALAHGLIGIGLTGNWGWKKKDEQTLLPLLAEFLPPGRTVVIVWDSDAALNSGFAASTRMLHDALRRQGCGVKVIVLPQSGTTKVGLDDFLIAKGADAFNALVDAAPILPSDHQVGTDELLLQWCGALLGALNDLPVPEAEALLVQNFKKGLIDQIPHATRLEILLRLQSGCRLGVERIFRCFVEEHLVTQFGPLSIGTGDFTLGDKVKFGDDKRAVVVAVDGNFLWVGRYRDKGRSWPVPAGYVEKFETVPPPAVLADEFLSLNYTRDDVLTLRRYREVFYRWGGNNYGEIPNSDLEAEVMGFLREWSTQAAIPAIRQAVVANVKASGVSHVPAGVTLPCRLEPGFPPFPNVISFTNGNLDVDALVRGVTDEEIWSAPTPLLFSLHGRDFAFDQEATCPRWQTFLEEVLPDEDLRLLVQEIAGYCLVPDTTMQRFFLLFGPGANGKQVFSEVLTKLVGADSVCSVPLSRFGERFALWPLTTSLVNLVAELPAAENGAAKIAEDKLKAIVSGDFIEVEKKNKDIVKARPMARLIFFNKRIAADSGPQHRRLAPHDRGAL